MMDRSHHIEESLLARVSILYDAIYLFSRRYLYKQASTSANFIDSAKTLKLDISQESFSRIQSLFEQYAQTNNIEIWDKSHRFYIRLKELNESEDLSYETFRRAIENEDMSITVNTILFLVETLTLLENQYQ